VNTAADGQLREGRVDKAKADPVREQLLSAFPEGAFARVDVLGYGDDPAVEPGDTAVRVFIDRAGRPEENWDSQETLHEWAKANGDGIEKLHEGLLPSIAWVEFFPAGGPVLPPCSHGGSTGIRMRQKPARPRSSKADCAGL
jgi:hypothetical protein